MKILKQVTVTALCLACFLKCGAATIDSLRKCLVTATTVNDRARLIFQLGRGYFDSNPDSSGYYFSTVAAFGPAAREDTFSVYTMAARGVINYNKDPDKSRKYYMDALRLARKFGVVDMQSYVLTELSSLATDIASYHMAIDYLKQAFSLEVARHRRDRQAMLYSRMGSAYSMLNDYSSALTAFGNALHIDDSLGRLYNVAGTYSGIGIVFSKQKKYKEALRYMQLEDSLSLVLKDTSSHLINRVNLGILYKNMGNYDRAIAIYEEALRSSSMDSFFLMSIYHNLAVALSLNKRFGEADLNFQKASDMMEQLGRNSWFAIQNYMEFSRAKLLEHDLDKALFYALQADKVVTDSKASAEEHKDIMLLLSDIYKARGDMTKAYEYYRKYADLQDTVFHTQASRNIAEAETRLNLLEKDNQVAALSRQNELQKLRTQKENIINISLLVGLVLGLLFVIIIIRAYRKTLKQNEQLKEQREVIDVQVEQLAAAGNMKLKFFANISHELRTPVTLLTGMLELLQDKVTGNAEKEKLSVAFSNSRKLQQMIEEMLDLSRLESGLPVAKMEKKEIGILTKRIVYAFETLMQKQELLFSYANHTMGDVYVWLDEDRYEKIINNLLQNAIKFNHAGGSVSVELSLLAEEGKVLIIVKDTGRGISAADLPHIFERFYQGSLTLKPAVPGSGIGLSLVKEFTEFQNGEVTVSSRPGEGSSFTLIFPIVDAGPEVGQPDMEEIPKPELLWEQLKDSPTILLVEDNAEMRYYLKEILTGKGTIIESGNGVEALQYLERQTPDLIISDVMMPEMDGQTFLGHVKNSRIWNKIPVIMLTALATKEDQLRMLSMGVDDYIVKPFNAGELRIRVFNLLHNQVVRMQWINKPAEPDELSVQQNDATELQAKICEYVSARMRDTTLSVPDLASYLVLSERQLYRLSNTLMGCTPAQLIKEVRLKKAYDLLVGGDVYKVEDVARRVGFENTTYFSRQFLARFGKRPAEFL